jgi:protein TonB
MKVRHVPIFAVAVLVSLVLHGVMWQTSRVVPVHPAAIEIKPPAKRGFSSFTVTLNPPGPNPQGSLAPPDSSQSQKPDPADKTPALPPPPIKPLEKPDVEKYPDEIGRAEGKGIGSHEAEGAKPLQARVAESDQPWLSRDPRGPAWPVKPSPSLDNPGDGGTGGAAGGPPAPQVVAAPPPLPKEIKPIEHAEKGDFRPGPIDVKIPTHAEGIDSNAQKILEQAKAIGPLTPERPGVADVRPTAKPQEGVAKSDRLRIPDLRLEEKGELALAPPPPPRAVLAMSPPPAPLVLRAPPPVIGAETPSVTPAAESVVAPQPNPNQATGSGGRPGTPSPAADPAQESDSEVDAFSKIEGMVRQDGRLEVQFGRQVKTVRPRLPISAMIDAALGARSVTLRVSIGKAGNVTAVSVAKSSGSNEVDQSSLIAMYDWWFEPAKDKKGRPVTDVIYFTLNFR